MSSDEMTSANQDPNLKGSFKFGRGQFFPMILLLVRNGRRVEEYTGVINEVRKHDIDIKSFYLNGLLCVWEYSTQGPLIMFAYNDIIYMVYKAVCYMIQHRPALSHL